MKVRLLQVKSGPRQGQWVVVYYDDDAECNVPFGHFDEDKVLGYFPTTEEADAWIRGGEKFEMNSDLPPLFAQPPPLPTETKRSIDYARYLERGSGEPDPPSLPLTVTEKKKHPRRADYPSYGAYAAAVYEQYGAAGSMGTVDVVGAFQKQIGLGCALLKGAWPAEWISYLIDSHYFLVDSIEIPAADQRWVNRWKFWTKWGWFGYGGIGVLGTLGGWEGAFCNFLAWVDWLLVIWPCVIFTLVALVARWRVGWPIFLVNLYVLVYIVKTVLKWILIVCTLGLVIGWLEDAFKAHSKK